MDLLPARTGGGEMIGAWGVNSVNCVDALALLRGMADQSVDMVLTSPPYNIQRKTRTGTGMLAGRTGDFVVNGQYDNYDDDMPEDEYQGWLRNVVGECLRVSKGLVWINHKTRYRNGAGIHPLTFLTFPLWSEVVWNRRTSITMNSRRFAPSHEYFFGFGRPHYWNDKMNTLLSVWTVTRGSANQDLGHPCPYPYEIVWPFIEASCPPTGIVLDPFAGSGTTGVTAQRLGRRYILGDSSPEYCEVARKRLAQPYTVNMFEALPTEVA